MRVAAATDRLALPAEGKAASIFVVVNPAADGGRTGRAWPGIAAAIGARLGPFSHSLTARRGDATTLVRAALGRGADLVIAVGGDGTANEAVNGFRRPDGMLAEAGFALLPAGTGSDSARGLDLRPNPTAALAGIAAGQVRRIDLGVATYRDEAGKPAQRLFLNNAGCGLSGAVDRAVDGSRGGWLPRKAVFLAATVRSLAACRFRNVWISFDGQERQGAEITLLAAGNGRFFGGGMMIAPDARWDDGLLEVVVLHATSKVALLRDLRLVYGGRHRDHPAVSIRRARRVEVEAADDGPPVPVDIDGESPGGLPAAFEVLPRALSLVG